jgi:uncharacterized membrane protein YgcG
LQPPNPHRHRHDHCHRPRNLVQRDAGGRAEVETHVAAEVALHAARDGGAEVERLRRQGVLMRKQVVEVRERMQALTRTNAELEGRVRELRQALDRAHAAEARSRAASEVQARRVQELTDNVLASQAALARTQTALTARDGEVATLRTELAEARARMTALGEAVARKSAALEEAERSTFAKLRSAIGSPRLPAGGAAVHAARPSTPPLSPEQAAVHTLLRDMGFDDAVARSAASRSATIDDAITLCVDAAPPPPAPAAAAAGAAAPGGAMRKRHAVAPPMGRPAAAAAAGDDDDAPAPEAVAALDAELPAFEQEELYLRRVVPLSRLAVARWLHRHGVDVALCTEGAERFDDVNAALGWALSQGAGGTGGAGGGGGGGGGGGSSRGRRAGGGEHAVY